MKKEKIVLLFFAIATIILEILPYGAVCNFSRALEGGGGAIIRETYSYFDLLPFGYANFGPFLTAIISCVILLLVVIACFVDKLQLIKTLKVCTGVAIVTSLMPLMFGITYFSIVGGVISALLVLEFAWVRSMIKQKGKEV